jgi:membrane protein implicated in regulation of membrane protease activity
VPDWLSQVSAFTVFLGIGGIGFLFLLISLIFGEVFEHFDSSFDHDLDHGGPTVLSPRVMSVFITAFGGFGAMATHYGLTILPASGVAFISGVVFAAVIYYFARFLYGQQATTEVRSADITGRIARVTVAIPGGGVGQVRLQVGEEIFDKVARSTDGAAIGLNAIVEIQEVLGEVVIVRPH